VFTAESSGLKEPVRVRLVAVGGLDPGGGAGLVRDHETATALGAESLLVGTAWTDQSVQGVAAVEPRPPERLRAALENALRAAAAVTPAAMAVKVGMVATPALAEVIAAALANFAGPIVFDPVLAASSGGPLFAGSLAGLDPLLRCASLVTPNLAEAAALAGSGPITTVDGARAAGEALLARGARAVLVKGGHLSGPPIDLLVTAEGIRPLAAERIPGPSPRGTGCALATAIAIALARGSDLPAAVESSKGWLLTRIQNARLVGEERHL
jgi:hydroxymethylpyrimidine/phosphomethylpyrimidine kinase